MQSGGMQVAGDCSMVSSDKKGPEIDEAESNQLLKVEEEIKMPDRQRSNEIRGAAEGGDTD